jgi:phospholipid/cholesterol/gamma-HCH transport system ATP-binding protein
MDDLILSLNQNLGVTIVIVTHELESIARVAKHCILLHRDRRGIIASGDPRVLVSQSSDVRVREFFRSAQSKVVAR